MKSILKLFLFFALAFTTQMSYAQVNDAASEAMESEKTEKEMKPQVFKDFDWLGDVINVKDCKGTKVIVHTKTDSPHKYLTIEENGKRVMYNTEGKLYCTDSKELNCAEYYKLTNEVDSWSCK